MSLIKKNVIVILTIILILTIAVFVYSYVPADVTEVYNDFLKAFSTGTYDDIDPYLHYEIPEHRILNGKYFSNIANYNIQTWKRLSSNLWLAVTYVQLTNEETGNTCYHFVGMIDGKWRIMLGAHHVPQGLSSGIDLSSYVPENELPMDVDIVPLF